MMTVVWGGMRAVTSTIKEGIQSAIAAPETENLFRVALGNMANDAEQFAVRLKNNLGLDEYITKDMLGTFQQIGTAVGVGQSTAYGMSKSMTMLANDMASLYNVDPQQAYENLQSASQAGKGRSKVWLCHYRTNHQRGCMAQWTGQKRAGIKRTAKICCARNRFNGTV